VEGFLVIKLGLEADEQIPRDPETELNAQGEVGADAFFPADHIAELRLADFHRFRGLDLGHAVMGNGFSDESGGGI